MTQKLLKLTRKDVRVLKQIFFFLKDNETPYFLLIKDYVQLQDAKKKLVMLIRI